MTGGCGSGRVTADVPGIDCGSDCDQAFPRGWWITLTATPDAGSEFAGWSDGVCLQPFDPVCRIKLDRDESVAASFKLPDKRLTVRVTGGEHGEVWVNGMPCRGLCESTYIHGAQVDLFAWSDAGASFSGWTGDCSGFGPCALVMDRDREVGAAFGDPAEPVSIATTSLPGGLVGVPFRAAIEARGGVPPYRFRVAKGRLPIRPLAGGRRHGRRHSGQGREGKGHDRGQRLAGSHGGPGVHGGDRQGGADLHDEPAGRKSRDPVLGDAEGHGGPSALRLVDLRRGTPARPRPLGGRPHLRRADRGRELRTSQRWPPTRPAAARRGR